MIMFGGYEDITAKIAVLTGEKRIDIREPGA